MVKFFTEFSHSFATYSSPPHPLQIPGIPWGQTLNQNNVVCSFSFWWSSKWLMALLWCHTQTLHPFTARPVVLALTCGRITNTQLMQIFTMKKMYVIFFSFIVSYSLLTSRFPSILCYLSLGSWNLIHVFPPVFLLLPPPLRHARALSSALCLILRFSRPTADCLFCWTQRKHGWTLHRLKIYCWAPTRLRSDMYLEQGLLITASFHIAKENSTAYAGNTLDDHISGGVQIIH